MSAGVGGPENGSQDFDLNITPIIDCFTVLIAFMLASAAFISIGILDAGVAASGNPAQESTTPPPIAIAVELQKDHVIEVHITGKETTNKVIKADANQWNHKELDAYLATLKLKYKDVNAMTLYAQDAIPYEDLILTMEQAKKAVPVILLGGF